MNKKILVLVMSCTLPYYRAKEKNIRETWGKPILDGEYSDVDLWFFNSGTKNCMDESMHRIFVKTDDRRDRTFQKLAKILIYIDEHPDVFDYDFIVRVNISSVINVPLFQELISNHIKNLDELWTSTTFNQPWVANHAPFFSGECFILSKKNISILKDFYISNKQTFDALENDPANEPKKACDDGWMTHIFFNYYKNRYTTLLKTFGIIYEPFPELHFTKDYDTHLVICFKTDDCYNTASTDSHPLNEECDKLKREKITEIVLNSKVPNKWWQFFQNNILDNECRSSLHRLENAFCTKQDVVDKWHKFLNDGQPESDYRPKPNPEKIWKF